MGLVWEVCHGVGSKEARQGQQRCSPCCNARREGSRCVTSSVGGGGEKVVQKCRGLVGVACVGGRQCMGSGQGER